MKNGSDNPNARVERARHLVVTTSHLAWEERVLLAAAEAAQAAVAGHVRAEVACAIADKAAHAFASVTTVSAAQVAVADAVVSSGLPALPGQLVTRITWRLVFDLWGGPGR